MFSPFALQYGLRAKPKNSAVFADVPSEAQENIQEGKKSIFLYALACSNAIGTSLAGKTARVRASSSLAMEAVPIHLISTHI
jgi:hypothetical protein